MPKTNKADIIKDAVRRFHHLPDRTIARYVLQTHGDLFNNDLESIRRNVRYQTGKNGDRARNAASDKSLFKDAPSKIPKTWRKTRSDYKLKPGLWAVFSDIHAPFHEPLPIEVAVSYAQSQKVDGIFFNGDLQDCASVSYWPKAKRDFNAEIAVVIDLIDWFRKEFPEQEFVYKPGNHEYALPRYYMANAPHLAATPLAAMETTIGFEERGIEFLDYHQIVMAGKLPVIHGHEVSRIDRSVNPARGLFLRTKNSSACSHCHTTSQHTPKNIMDEVLSTWSFGCLCDLHPDFNVYGQDWNWGMALIDVSKDGSFEVENRKILPSGKLA